VTAVLCVIPARYASQRFPGKPLVQIGGRPMIQRVYEAASRSGVFGEVIVATDDARISDAVRAFGGKVEMTGAQPSGTHRVAEVAERHPQFDVVANVQGDQPFLTASILAALVEPYRRGFGGDMTTVASPLSASDRTDPNSVKVACDARMRALYFTRANIPHYRTAGNAPVYKHLGLYAFSRQRLLDFVELPETPLERCESLEQLRALEHGYTIGVTLVSESPPEINGPADMEAARAWISSQERGTEQT
jgi:3-deoxy-manno-octulosonate cytidylyltransferase (CMP-KDO synthetase)